MDVTVKEIADAREKRAAKQKELIKKYGETVICFTMNIPGPEKNNDIIRKAMEIGKRNLLYNFKILDIIPLHTEEYSEHTGPVCFYVIAYPAEDIKRIAVEIEGASPLGRLFDIDVIRKDGTKTKRSELGLPERKCLICDNDAFICARSRNHSIVELKRKTFDILHMAVNKEKSEIVASLAVRALLFEALTTPKPGLVDRINNGSHKDMDIFTFASSASALFSYYEKCAFYGADTAGENAADTFYKIRKAGKIAELKMLDATKGVNTHRGAIFSLGILCAAAGRLEKDEWLPGKLLDECADMTKGLTDSDFGNLSSEKTNTYGEKLYFTYGIKGVRGEVEEGSPNVRYHGYPKFKAALSKGLSLNDAGCAALIAIMANTMDTNVIHRSSINKQKELCQKVKEILEREEFPSSNTLVELDKELIEMNISPGGCADLLTICYMLYFLEEASS